MLVRDVMTPDPVVVTPDLGVAQARALARHRGVDHLPVVHHECLVGMLTPRELEDGGDGAVATAIGHAARLSVVAPRRVRELMRPAHPVVSPEQPVSSAARLLLEERCSGAAVLDERFRVVGLLTTADLLVAGMRPER